MNDSVPDIAGRDLSLTAFDRQVLYALPFQPRESITLSEVDRRTGWSAPVETLKKLESMGLVEVTYRRIASPIL